MENSLYNQLGTVPIEVIRSIELTERSIDIYEKTMISMGLLSNNLPCTSSVNLESTLNSEIRETYYANLPEHY